MEQSIRSLEAEANTGSATIGCRKDCDGLLEGIGLALDCPACPLSYLGCKAYGSGTRPCSDV